MPLPNQQLPYLRYLKSQLLNLKRPSFWGTALFLCVVGVIVREYWANPRNIFALDKQQDKPIVTQQQTNTGLTEDERSLFADIDNLPVFLNDYEQGLVSIEPIITPANNQNQKSDNFLEEAFKKQNKANEAKSKANLPKNSTAANAKNPFVLQAENLLQPEISSGNGRFVGYKYFNNSLNQTRENFNTYPLETGLTNQNRQIQNTGFDNPLDTKSNQYSNQDFPSLTKSSVNSPINPYQVNNQNFPGFTNSSTNSSSAFGHSLGSRQVLIPNPNLPTNNGIGYIDPSISKPLPNSSGSLNDNQTLPSQITPVTGNAPITNTIPNNNYLNNNPSFSNQGQGTVNYPNPAGYSNYRNSNLPQSNYGNYRGYGVQQPARLPQSNYGNYGGYGVQQPSQIPQSNYSNPGLQQPSQLSPNSTYPGQPEQYQNNYGR